MKIQDQAEVYHKTRAINNSMLKQYIDNPFMAGLRYWSDVKLPEVSKEAYKQGDALHAKVLEPERFNDEYTIKPEGLSLATKEGKLWKSENSHKSIVDPILLEQEAVLMFSPFAKWFKEGENEASIYGEHEGVKTKARFDCIYNDTILDLKTTSARSEQEFLEHCISFKYDVQQVWYSRMFEKHFGYKPKAFIFLAVTKSSPVNIFYQILPSELVARGKNLVDSTLPLIISSINENSWPLRESKASLEAVKPWILEAEGVL